MQCLWSSEVWEWWVWWQTGACIQPPSPYPCPAHHPQPQVIHIKTWKRCDDPTRLGPESVLGLPLFGSWSKRHCFLLQISYKYLIIALGIQLDYGKVRLNDFCVPWPTSAKIKHCLECLYIHLTRKSTKKSSSSFISQQSFYGFKNVSSEILSMITWSSSKL